MWQNGEENITFLSHLKKLLNLEKIPTSNSSIIDESNIHIQALSSTVNRYVYDALNFVRNHAEYIHLFQLHEEIEVMQSQEE